MWHNFTACCIMSQCVTECYNTYCINKISGANNLLGAISHSPAGRVRTILNELSHEKHEARYVRTTK